MKPRELGEGEPMTRKETRLLLIRHGNTEWHGLSRVLGQNDIPLNAVGLEQARSIAAALAGIGITQILTSPLARAAQTAEVLGERAGVATTVDARLTDMRVGEWEGMTYADLATRDDYRSFVADPLETKIPGGETLGQARERAAAAISDAVESAIARQVLAVVTHSDIVRLMLCHYLGASLGLYTKFRIAVASVSTVLLFGETSKVVATNWRPSLEEILFPAAQ